MHETEKLFSKSVKFAFALLNQSVLMKMTVVVVVVATVAIVENRIFWFCYWFRERKLTAHAIEYHFFCCCIWRLYFHIISIVISEFQPSNRVDREPTYKKNECLEKSLDCFHLAPCFKIIKVLDFDLWIQF